MNSGFPQYTPSAKLGDVGVGIVSRLVSEDFNWLFKRNHQEHDFGIDGQIEVVTDEGSVTGQMLACQIKCGISFFRESNKWGYVYRGEMKHFNYLANYPMPVIIVLCNPTTQEAIWEKFQPNSARITEGGWTITIPFENKLSASKAALIRLLPPVSDHAAHLKEYWRINNMLLSVEHILFLVDREDVEGMSPKPTLDFLARLRSTKELAYHCQGKLALGFSGYDDEPRELFEVDEVKKFVVVLDKAFPELFFFSRRVEPGSTIMLFIFCLAGVGWAGQRSTPGNSQPYEIEHGQVLGDFIFRHFEGLNAICEWLGLPEEDIERMSFEVGKLVGYPGKRQSV